MTTPNKGKTLIQISVDQGQMEEILLDEIKQNLKNFEQKKTFWDMKELQRQTCMSRPSIIEYLYPDERFQALSYKIGAKWYFLAEEMQEFLLLWLREQERK